MRTDGQDAVIDPQRSGPISGALLSNRSYTDTVVVIKHDKADADALALSLSLDRGRSQANAHLTW